MRSVKMIMRAAAIVVVAASPAPAQTPGFAGRWTLAPEPPSRTQGGGRLTSSAPGPLWGSDLTLSQDATTLTVEYARFARSDMQPPTRLVYRLDGSESRNTINIGRGPQEQVSRARWEGDRLIIVTEHRFTTSTAGVTPGKRQSASNDRAAAVPVQSPVAGIPQEMTSETTQVLWLESPASLVIETTSAGVMGGPSSTTRSVFRKG